MDTLVFRLHNLEKKYPLIWQIAQAQKTGKQLVQVSGSKPKETVDTVVKFFLNFDAGTAQAIRYSDKTHVPSSNHDIPFFIDQPRNFLEVNVSIPKFLFGNNVLEAIIPPGHKLFSANQLSPYAHIDFWYSLIKRVIFQVVNHIAKKNYTGLDWNDVEVNRLDLAFNQLHSSAPEAKRYLHHQGGIPKKHQRANATGREIKYDGETLFFPSQHYSVKIYHKGSEFEKLQLKNIINANKKRKSQALRDGLDPQLLSSNIQYASDEVQRLQSYSDRILRYEFTFRPGYMSYLFNRKINKFWSKNWTVFKKMFDYLEKDPLNKVFLHNHSIKRVDMQGAVVPEHFAVEEKYFVHQNIEVGYEGSGVWKTVEREFTDKEYQFFRLLRKHGIRSRSDYRNWQKFMTRELNRMRQVQWKIDGIRDTSKEVGSDADGHVLYKNHAMTETPEYIRFSRTMLRFMVTEVHKFFDNFQIDSKPTYSEFIDKIEKHNETIERRLLTADAVDKKLLEADYIKPRTARALIEMNNLFSKLSIKTIRGKYTKTTYHRLIKLHRKISGQKFQLASAQFGDVHRDFNTLYKGLHSEMQKGYLLKFYNTAFGLHFAK